MAKSSSRLLVIGLDGLEVVYAEKLMDAGLMPALAALRQRSAAFLLDHGAAQRTGLAWEHVASGLSPQDADRWSAVEFNSETYEAWQVGTKLSPFLGSLDANVVVFDAPYFDLDKAPHVQGVVGWGAHDPGIAPAAHPSTLRQELHQRFGDYPSAAWLYACPGYSVQRCQQMGVALVEAVQVRQQAARWLLTERFPEAEVFFVVTGELHSAIEGLWHGIDPNHPLHTHASAPAAAQALLEVHQAIDRMVGDLVQAVPDAEVVAFAMGGMGPNQSDLESMLLLPELLYRHAFGRSRLHVPHHWSIAPDAIPQLAGEHWDLVKTQWFKRDGLGEWWTTVQEWLHQGLRLANLPSPWRSKVSHSNLWWHAALQYQPWWSQMPAFALPSFYDGKIRINLQGREQRGIVPVSDYEATCTHLETMLRQCCNPRSNLPVVVNIERPSIAHPFDLASSDADITVVWQGMATAFQHPDYGLIGPVPYRRTGGHTGAHGIAWIASPRVQPGFCGVSPSFNVMPTIAELLQETVKVPVSGRSLLSTVAD